MTIRPRIGDELSGRLHPRRPARPWAIPVEGESTPPVTTYCFATAGALPVKGERSMADGDLPRSLAQKLDHLFATVRPREGREASYRDVATAITDRGGPTISPSYIWQLRSGVKDNPTLKHLQALASYFGVETAYFFDDEATERVDSELALQTAMRDAGVRAVALRAEGLSPESLELVLTVIDGARRLQNQPRRRRGSGSGYPPQAQLVRPTDQSP